MMKAMSATMGVVERVLPVPANYSAEYLRISAGVTYIGSNARARREHYSGTSKENQIPWNSPRISL